MSILAIESVTRISSIKMRIQKKMWCWKVEKITKIFVHQSEHTRHVYSVRKYLPVIYSGVSERKWKSFQSVTLIQLRKLLPYFCSKALLMSFKSISQRVTISRINWLSLVPRPAILLCSRDAKNSALFEVHCKIATRPSCIQMND